MRGAAPAILNGKITGLTDGPAPPPPGAAPVPDSAAPAAEAPAAEAPAAEAPAAEAPAAAAAEAPAAEAPAAEAPAPEPTATATAETPVPAPTESPVPSPAVADSPAPPPAEGEAAGSPSPAPEAPSPSPSPSPEPSPIADAPICACALQGIGSSDCLKALDARCGEPGAAPEVKDACGQVSLATTSADAAAKVAGFLANECFAGQATDEPPCVCFRDPNSNDCAKARLGLCVKRDRLCMPLQMGSDPAAVAAFARDACPVAAPDAPGVQVNLTFAALPAAKWTPQLTQNVGNAIAASGNVSTRAVRLVDVRPFVPAASAGRRLLQAAAGGATGGGSTGGVQAVYFAESADPDAVSTRLQMAASDGSLAKSLIAYGVPSSAQPTVALKSFYGGEHFGGLKV